MPSELLLATVNARYAHASLGLRYLLANLGPLAPRAELLEFVLGERPAELAEKLLARRPRLLGLGVYVWNAAVTREVVAIVKAVAPEVVVVLGGPEVSHELDGQPIVALADHVVTGEGEVAFRELCTQLLAGGRDLPKVWPGGTPDLDALALPYALYTDEDLSRRVLYVEASRGCPFRCEFCLSSLDAGVRRFSLERLLPAFDALLARGARAFKFVDRTFNLHPRTSEALLDYFLEKEHEELSLHFEVVPDRLPDGLRARLARFPAGAVQLELGVQSMDPEVTARIRREQDLALLADNLRFLRQQTGTHLHADLILGLPGETLDGIGRSFDALHALGPHEIQVGILKRLRGAPIARHEEPWRLVFDPEPPYELLRSLTLDFATLQRLKRFARYWDLVANSGNFRETLPLLLGAESAFAAFLGFSDWLYDETGTRAGIELQRLVELVRRYLTELRGLPEEKVGPTLLRDYLRAGRRVPECLARYAEGASMPVVRESDPGRSALPRQRRHRR